MERTTHNMPYRFKDHVGDEVEIDVNHPARLRAATPGDWAQLQGLTDFASVAWRKPAGTVSRKSALLADVAGNQLIRSDPQG